MMNDSFDGFEVSGAETLNRSNMDWLDELKKPAAEESVKKPAAEENAISPELQAIFSR